jgi:hypothetical protein
VIAMVHKAYPRKRAGFCKSVYERVCNGTGIRPRKKSLGRKRDARLRLEL